MATGTERTVLVVRHTGMGDLLTGLPALRAVRRSFPRHRIRTTCPSWLVPLARQVMAGDEYVVEPGAADGTGEPGTGSEPSRHQDIDGGIVDRALALGDDDVVVLLRVPDRALVERALAGRQRTTIGFQHPELVDTVTSPYFDFTDHILRRWSRLLAAFGMTCRTRDIRISLPVSRRPPGPRPTVVHVGAASIARRWPLDRWSDVVGELEARGHRVVLTGSQDEARSVAVVREAVGLPVERDLSGRTDAIELARLVRGARLVLSTETGPSHLATSLGTRSVTLFGATSPAWWGPPAGWTRHRTVWQGGISDPYGDTTCAGLLAITVRDVLTAATSGGW
jgi:ADP-heptose:LPS heptosyltransferase